MEQRNVDCCDIVVVQRQYKKEKPKKFRVDFFILSKGYHIFEIVVDQRYMCPSVASSIVNTFNLSMSGTDHHARIRRLIPEQSNEEENVDPNMNNN